MDDADPNFRVYSGCATRMRDAGLLLLPILCSARMIRTFLLRDCLAVRYNHTNTYCYLLTCPRTCRAPGELRFHLHSFGNLADLYAASQLQLSFRLVDWAAYISLRYCGGFTEAIEPFGRELSLSQILALVPAWFLACFVDSCGVAFGFVVISFFFMYIRCCGFPFSLFVTGASKYCKDTTDNYVLGTYSYVNWCYGLRCSSLSSQAPRFAEPNPRKVTTHTDVRH